MTLTQPDCANSRFEQPVDDRATDSAGAPYWTRTSDPQLRKAVSNPPDPGADLSVNPVIPALFLSAPPCDASMQRATKRRSQPSAIRLDKSLSAAGDTPYCDLVGGAGPVIEGAPFGPVTSGVGVGGSTGNGVPVGDGTGSLGGVPVGDGAGKLGGVTVGDGAGGVGGPVGDGSGWAGVPPGDGAGWVGVTVGDGAGGVGGPVGEGHGLKLLRPHNPAPPCARAGCAAVAMQLNTIQAIIRIRCIDSLP